MSDYDYGVIAMIAGSLGLIFALRDKPMLAWMCGVTAVAALVGMWVN